MPVCFCINYLISRKQTRAPSVKNASKIHTTLLRDHKAFSNRAEYGYLFKANKMKSLISSRISQVEAYILASGIGARGQLKHS